MRFDLTRRTFLALAASLPWWASQAVDAQTANDQAANEKTANDQTPNDRAADDQTSSAPMDQRDLESFLDWSQQATGFETLDPRLGRTYLDALIAWEPELENLLSKPPQLLGLTAREQGLVDLIIETWYTGSVPTVRGTKTLTFEGALAWKCLPRPVPVTYCPK